MSSYSSLLPLRPADWVGGGGGDAEDMAAAAVLSSYISFDADEYYHHPPERQGTLFDALQQADVDLCVSGEAGSNGGREASEQSRTDASSIVPIRPPGHDMINNKAKTKSKIAFRTRSDVDVLDDGYRWRKYGKKMVKNSPNPRNYYRCSSEGCHVKKRVERERDDARFVITTYDGVHNHPAAPRPPSRACNNRLGEQRVQEGEGPSPINQGRLAT